MSHLTDEQFEDLLQGRDTGRDHLDGCVTCQARLKEKEALAARLRRAFASLTPEAGLAQGIRSELGLVAPPVDPARSASRAIAISGRQRRAWTTGLSAVAAVLLVAFLVAISLTPSAAQATQSTLAGLHTLNLTVDKHTFWTDTDPNRLRAHYAEILGVAPFLPPITERVQLCSCCVQKCITQYLVGSYVAGTSEGVITIAVVVAPAETLGEGRAGPGGRVYYEAQQDDCRMVAVDIGGQTYSAVGKKVDYSQLRALLAQLDASGGSEAVEGQPTMPSQIPMH